ncbi:MAG: hypothetical protein AAGK47_03850 [Bacteroidota bacterium]
MYRLLILSLYIVAYVACQSESPGTTPPIATKDETARVDKLVQAIDATEDAVQVRKTYEAGDVTYKLQGTFLNEQLIRLVANTRSEYFLDSQSWYFRQSKPIYYRQFYNQRDCGTTAPQHCLAETILYFDDTSIAKALRRTRNIDPTTQPSTFSTEVAQPFSTNIDSLHAALGAELDIYRDKIK